MASKKDFENYAKSVFGEDFGKVDSKSEFDNKLNSADVRERHPLPLDVVVVDKHDKRLDGSAISKKGHFSMPNSLNISNKFNSTDSGRLTPIEIDFDDRSADESEGFLLGGLKPEHARTKQLKNNARKGSQTLKRQTSARTDSGIYLNDTDDDRNSSSADESIFQDFTSRSASRERQKGTYSFDISENSDDSDSEVDLAYFCIDHMKLCQSKSEMRRHKNCNHGSPSFQSTPFKGRTPASKLGSATLFSARGTSRNSARGREKTFLTPSMHAMYVEMMENMYTYSGLIIEDRESLKVELRDRKTVMEEHMLNKMENLITNILKMKKVFLERLEDFHQANLDTIAKQTIRLQKLRHETKCSWQKMHVPDDFDDFEKYHHIIYDAARKTIVLQEIIKNCYDSSVCYDYELEASPETNALLELENVAHVETQLGLPALPPFLKKSVDEHDDCEDTVKRVLPEFVQMVHDSDNMSRAFCCFTGCAYIQADALLLIDWSNGSVNLVNNHGVLTDTLPFEQSPWDVVRVDMGKAAVTVPKLGKIVFIESDPHLHVLSAVDTHCECFGICKIDSRYAVTCDPCSKSPSVQMFTETGELVWKLQTDGIGECYFKCPLHLGSDFFNSVIYVSDSTADSVYGLSLTGDILFCYSHEHLEYPTGVCSDRNNMIYVCGKKSSVIHKLANDGTFQRAVTEKHDGLKSPCALCLHPDGDHFVATDIDGQNSSGFWKLVII